MKWGRPVRGWALKRVSFSVQLKSLNSASVRKYKQTKPGRVCQDQRLLPGLNGHCFLRTSEVASPVHVSLTPIYRLGVSLCSEYTNDTVLDVVGYKQLNE